MAARRFWSPTSGGEQSVMALMSDQPPLQQSAELISGEDIVIDPLTATMWVDPDTAVALADQNGSIVTPFASVQQAHDALPANGGTIVLTFSADEVSAGNLVASKSIGLQGLGQGADLGDISTTVSLVLDNVIADNITSTGTTLRLTHARAGTIDVGPNSVTLVDALVTGVVTAGQLIARDSELTSEGHAIEALAQTVNCTIGSITVSAGEIESENDSYISSASASTSITAKGSTFGGAVDCATLDAAQCTFGGELGVDEINVSGDAILRECSVGIDTTVIGGLDMFDTTCTSADGNVALDSGSGVAINCELGGNWVAGAELDIDQPTYNRAIASGFTVTATSMRFNDGAESAGQLEWDLSAPIVLTMLPAGHVPGYYQANTSLYMRVAALTGNVNGVTLAWSEPGVGAATNVFGVVLVTTTGLLLSGGRTILSDGTAAVTFTYTPALITGAPRGNVVAAATYMGTMVT